MARGSRSLNVVLGGDAAGLKRAFAQASMAAREYETQSARSSRAVVGHQKVMTSGVERFGKAAISAAKAGLALGAAYVSISEAKQAISVTEELAKATISLHKNLGLSVKSASEWAAVAKSRDIDAKALNMSFGTLSKNVEAASLSLDKQHVKLAALTGSQADQIKKQAILATGAGAQAQALQRLGVTQDQIKKGNFQDVLFSVADGLGKMHAGTEKTALSMKLFGRGWQTIVPVLREGSQAMRDQLALANKYGATFGGKTIKSVKDLIAQQREMRLATIGLQIAFGTQLAPALIKVIPAITKFINQIRTGKGAGGDFAAAMRFVVSVLRLLVDMVKQCIHGLDNLLGLVSTFLRGVAKAAGAFGWLPGVGGKFKDAAAKINNAADSIDHFRAKLRGADSAANSLSGIPKLQRGIVRVGQAFDSAQSKALTFITTFEALNNLPALNVPSIPKLKPLTGKAAGGPVGGSGRGDIVPAMLEPGEFVIQRKVVEKYGPTFFANLNQGWGHGGPKMAAGGPVAHSASTFGLSGLESLWLKAGGRKDYAVLMAHVALAESSGNPMAHNASGASGLWQILGQPFAGNVFDPLTNARMAVWKLNNQGLGAWAASEGSWGQYRGTIGQTPSGSESGAVGPGTSTKAKAPPPPIQPKFPTELRSTLKQLGRRMSGAQGGISDVDRLVSQSERKGDYGTATWLLKAKEQDEKAMRSAARQALRGYKKELKILRHQFRTAPKGRRSKIQQMIQTIQGRIKDLKGTIHDLGFDIKDTELDIKDEIAAGEQAAADAADTSGTDTSGTGTDDSAAIIQANTDALNALKDELKRQTDFGKAVSDTTESELRRALVGMLNGDLGGMAYPRTLSPGDGSRARY